MSLRFECALDENVDHRLVISARSATGSESSVCSGGVRQRLTMMCAIQTPTHLLQLAIHALVRHHLVSDTERAPVAAVHKGLFAVRVVERVLAVIMVVRVSVTVLAVDAVRGADVRSLTRNMPEARLQPAARRLPLSRTNTPPYAHPQARREPRPPRTGRVASRAPAFPAARPRPRPSCSARRARDIDPLDLGLRDGLRVRGRVGARLALARAGREVWGGRGGHVAVECHSGWGGEMGHGGE